MEINTAERAQCLKKWLHSALGASVSDVVPASEDASFRRYFRVSANGRRYIVMDAPPEFEDCRPFVAIAKALRACGIRAPEVFAEDLSQGFLLLSDFGDRLLLDALRVASPGPLYQKAYRELLTLQRCQEVPDYPLPEFDESMQLNEMHLSRDWYLQKLLEIPLPSTDLAQLERYFQHIAEQVMQQPKVFVHRDFHSRNIMCLESGELGIIDFQDAVWGPITYDILSLLRDCYIDWPPKQVERWLADYLREGVAANIIPDVSFAEFLRWFDYVGIQRNLKCIGIFARLGLRDGKRGFLSDIPRVIHYAKQVCKRHQDLEDLQSFLTRRSVSQ